MEYCDNCMKFFNMDWEADVYIEGSGKNFKIFCRECADKLFEDEE